MLRFLPVICVIVIEALVTHGYTKFMDGGYQIDVVNGSYSTNIVVNVSSDRESIIHFEKSISYFPYTVFAWSYDVDPSFPIFIMVRQQKEATSWKIPLLVQSNEGMLSFYKTSRTLCHNNIDLITKIPKNSQSHTNQHDFDIQQRLSISVSTAYDIPTNVTIRVEEQTSFYLQENHNYSVEISPSEPRFFYYKFSDENNGDTGGTVILEIESEDDTCLTVSIQNATCPVFDLNQDISYEGKYETINTKGGIIVKETDFPIGLFIVLVAKGDNFQCDRKSSVIPMQNMKDIKPTNHSSVVMFKIRPNITHDKYVIATISTLAGFLIFYAIFGCIYCEFCSSGKKCNIENAINYQNLNNMDDDVVFDSSNHGEISITEMNNPPESHLTEAIDLQTSCLVPDSFAQEEVSTVTNKSKITVEMHSNTDLPQTSRNTTYVKTSVLDSSDNTLYQSVDEFEKDANTNGTVDNIINVIPDDQRIENNIIFEGIDLRLQFSQLYLSDLATREPNNIHQESINYFLQVISIGIFYGIPVVQLVVTHQRIVNVTGNLDACYYNFLCAHPFIGFNDYNHVLSNMGYILLGILFLIIARIHKKMPHKNNCGIPQHYGLYYAMGTALIMEGILSACYHVCPNQSNFQFDTSFMYVMAVLCVIKLYQNRHPDINATAYVTFLILAVAVLIAMVGILNGHILVWVGFICLYSGLCLYIAVKIYYLSDTKGGWMLICITRRDKGILRTLLIPRKKDRCVSVLTVTLINIILAHLGYLCYTHNVDFATFLLGLLLGNAVIYTIIYVIMKIKHRETLCIQSAVYFIVAGILWGFSIYFFVNNSTEWMATAADSKKRNSECILYDFYDYHDIWHLSSATALFFSFMLLLTLDNELVDIKHTKIPVF